MMAYDNDLIYSPPVPAWHHPTRGVAVPSVHPELPRCRGFARRARPGPLLRDGQAMGVEVRPVVRQGTSPQTSSTYLAMAPGRDGGANQRQTILALASGRRRG